MGKYIFNRLLQVLPVVVGVLIISFILMVILPGDPVLSMVGERYDENTVKIMREKLNLDKPLMVRMGMFFEDIIKGDLGNSFVSGRPVVKEILEKTPNTFILAVGAMVVAILVGVFLGMLTSFFSGSWFDKTIMVVALMGVRAGRTICSIPPYPVGGSQPK